MKIKIWGNATWNLLHTICEKVYDDKFTNSKNDIFKLISLICISVPCPICREHAIIFLKTNNIYDCKTKDELKRFVFNLHNHANINAKNNLFDTSILEQYKDLSFVKVYNNYTRIYNANKTDDLRYSFRRTINLREINNLLIKNTTNFNQ